jgi:D-amino-acid dehydrogenase
VSDVAVVGAGAIGLSIAEALSSRGADVEVLERGRCGAGASAGNAGWVTPSLSVPVPGPGVIATSLKWLLDRGSPLWIRPTLSAAMARWIRDFLRSCGREQYAAGLAVLQGLAGEAGGAFDRLAGRGVAFELHDDPLLYPAFTAGELVHLDRVTHELRTAGATMPIDRLGVGELVALEPALDSERLRGGLRVHGERRVRPESLTAGLREALLERGTPVHEQCRVHSVARNGAGWLVRADSGEHRTRTVVLANGVGARTVLADLGLRLPIVAAKGYSRTYAHHPGAPRQAVYLEEPKVSVSVFDGGMRISGTLELGARRLSLSERRLAAITAAARAAFPAWRPVEAPSDWAGMRSLSPDGIPFVGELPGHPGLWVATAHATLGITLAPLTGELVADALLEGRPHPLSRALDPGRALRQTRGERT